MKKFLSTTLLAFLSLALYAIPAYRGTVKRIQPDGTTLHILVQGDEHRHLITTTDGRPLMQDKDGWLCYAQLSEGRVECISSSPVAHDSDKRSAEEKAFLEAHATFGLNDITPANRAPQRIAEPGDMQVGSFPTKGQVRGLIILAEFSDVKFTNDVEYFQRIMNEEPFLLLTVRHATISEISRWGNSALSSMWLDLFRSTKPWLTMEETTTLATTSNRD